MSTIPPNLESALPAALYGDLCCIFYACAPSRKSSRNANAKANSSEFELSSHTSDISNDSTSYISNIEKNTIDEVR
jgi:hypothetical protein